MPLTRRQFLRSSLAAAGLLFGYSFAVERYLVQTNTYRIPVPNLPPAFAGLRIAHLTDVHYGPLMPLALIERVVARTNALCPDLIVCTGDYVNGRRSPTRIDAVWPVLAKLAAPMGVYSVLGNHDHWADTARSRYWLRETGQDLSHKTARLEREGQALWLAGAGDKYEDHRNLDILLGAIPDAECRLVLAHNPDTADTAYTKRVDLMISGHTHGGQVVIPFVGPPVLFVKNRNFTSGLKLSKRGGKVFISKGVGWATVPFRFNCLPEIAVLELVPETTGERAG